MANRPKTKRNQNIMKFWDSGSYTQQAIANMFKMKLSAVTMVIWREQQKRKAAKTAESIS